MRLETTGPVMNAGRTARNHDPAAGSTEPPEHDLLTGRLKATSTGPSRCVYRRDGRCRGKRCRRWVHEASVLFVADLWRTWRKVARTSAASSSGCSQAAKCPPLGSSL